MVKILKKFLNRFLKNTNLKKNLQFVKTLVSFSVCLSCESIGICYRILFKFYSPVVCSFWRIYYGVPLLRDLKWRRFIIAEQEHPRVSQQLIRGIMHFAHSAKNSDEVLEKAVVPVLTTLGNAPKTSPLKDANTNDIISFLAGITSLSNRPHVSIHNKSYF